MKQLFLFISTILILSAQAQEDFPVNGMRDKDHTPVLFKNATIHPTGDQVIDNGMMLVKDGRIVEVAHKIKAPKNARIIDLEGKHIYPSFIELKSTYGLKKEAPKKGRSYAPQYTSMKSGAYGWNEAFKPEVNASATFSPSAKEASSLQKFGIGTVLSHYQDGISRGTSVLSTIGNGSANEEIILDKACAHYSFRKGSSKQSYPSSLMGSIALLRQTYLDASWHKTTKEPVQANLSLDAFNSTQSLPQLFSIENKLSLLRADKIGDEFGVQYTFFGNGDEYQRLNEIKASNASLIIPINFPKPYDVEDLYSSIHVSLGDLKHWELAPANPYLLWQNGIQYSLSTEGHKKPNEFFANLRKAAQYGISEDQILNSLTIIPAQTVNAEDEIGSLAEGKIANFLICSESLLNKKFSIVENWIRGNKKSINPEPSIDIRGQYNLYIGENPRKLKVAGKASKPSGELSYMMVVDSITASGDLVLDSISKKPIKVTKLKKESVDISVDEMRIALSFSLKEGVYRLSGNINFDSGSWDGHAQKPSGEWFKWSAIRNEKHQPKPNKPSTLDTLQVPAIQYPLMAYGWDSLVQHSSILIKNATVWTLESEGTDTMDVMIQNGKIKHVGKVLDVASQETLVIDGTGLHLTPGIIDEHSHIAIERGVNEGSHAVTSEVSIGDVVKSNDINIYRQLAGGVTAAQLLHGSANPVGGQSALIKLRWGQVPDSMKIHNAPGFIKFALGENVKQSNWGSFNTIRYPQTRMGVEQIYYDAFIAAKEYKKEWSDFRNLPKKEKEAAIPPRKDLKMDVLLEILNSERFISCHSYVQSEINMLMHVADSMGFTVNTFTHILEGYKVADKMKKHGVGGSTFSDWWAYKFEVNDAIPYNASLLNEMGIVTAINSDDAEMARRLNHEAAKAIKYGKTSEEDALKMVTLNPAKLLHLDDQMGSIKVGKDADLVLWSGHPLSVYSKVEKTFIDGIIYFDKERDQKLQAEVQAEKARIISKMIESKKNGSGTRKIKGQKPNYHVCGTMTDEG